MKQRFGGLMCLLLGSVLVAGGSLGVSGAAAGVTPLSCGQQLNIGNVVAPTCPTGTITVTETSTGDQTPPSDWTVTITSTNCGFPAGGNSLTVTVPNGGSMTSGDLYQNTNGFGTTVCSYALDETAVTGFTATFSPAGPYTLPQTTTEPVGTSNVDVALQNDSAVTPEPTVTPSATVAPTATPTATGTPEPTTEPTTGSPSTTPSTAAAGSGGGGTGTLPRTGSPYAGLQIGLGAGLLLLGLVLLLAGRPSRTQD